MKKEPKTYYEPYEIIFNIDQLTYFLLPNYTLLIGGDYPRYPTGYTQSEYSSSNHQGTYYATPIEIGAEIHKRLEMIGTESLILLHLYEDHDIANQDDWYEVMKAQNEVAKYWHITIEKVIRRAQRMLRYISNKRRPEVDYYTWLRNGHNKYPVGNLIDSILESVFTTLPIDIF